MSNDTDKFIPDDDETEDTRSPLHKLRDETAARLFCDEMERRFNPAHGFATHPDSQRNAAVSSILSANVLVRYLADEDYNPKL